MMMWEIDMRSPEEAWAECDFTKDGKVDFMEFCDWAIGKHMTIVSEDES